MTDTDATVNEPVKNPTALAQLDNLFLSPSRALDYAHEHAKMWWLPFCITLGLQLILGIWIAATINIKYVHAMMAHAIMLSKPEHAQQAIQMINQHGRGFFMMGMVFGVVALGIGEVIFALYLFVADKLTSAASRGYGKWFSFTAWTWLPLTIATIIAGIVWGLSSHSAMPHDPTSLNALIFHFNPATQMSLYRVAQFSLLEIWVIALVAFGVKRWCNASTAKAIVVALIPYVAYYLIKFFI
jgi:hypothetical protein